MKEPSVIAPKRAKAPLLPKHPERICWGCEKFCPGDDLACGNGTIRTPHPLELFGDDWVEWANKEDRDSDDVTGVSVDRAVSA
jgi:hypothetical protein